MITPHGDPLGRIGEPDIGGQCVYVRELSRHLAAAGVRVLAFTRNRSDGKPERETFADGAEVIRVPCGPPGFIPKEDLLPHLDDFAHTVAEILQGDEIVHSHYWDGGYVANRLVPKSGWLHTTHSIGKLKQAALPGDARYRYDDRIRIETEVYRGCDLVLALTETERDQIASLYDVPLERIRIIPPGVDTDRFRPTSSSKSEVRSNLGLPEGLTLFTLGRLDERKGFDLFFHAAGLLRDAADPVPSIVISAGGGSPQEEAEQGKLDTIVTALNLRSMITWLPVLPENELPRYYQAADVFVLPSRYEPFGIVMLEAMASGIPVVATREGGPSKVIEHGVDGFLVDPTNAAQFAHAMNDLLGSHEMRSAFGRRAREKVQEEYGWKVIADRHMAAYGEASSEESHAR